ncbi:hypothetical protein GGX14DRAFT_626540 [Mycena pura]|uniref:Uncharacterized protein n=1 Tax=Mycena pura TaxID=153505 RepID=A0AAD6YF93_9AGAR|nr:hypothetical protein GGX14DRAFT_626540 [Mycena pura]
MAQLCNSSQQYQHGNVAKSNGKRCRALGPTEGTGGGQADLIGGLSCNVLAYVGNDVVKPDATQVAPFLLTAACDVHMYLVRAAEIVTIRPDMQGNSERAARRRVHTAIRRERQRGYGGDGKYSGSVPAAACAALADVDWSVRRPVYKGWRAAAKTEDTGRILGLQVHTRGCSMDVSKGVQLTDTGEAYMGLRRGQEAGGARSREISLVPAGGGDHEARARNTEHLPANWLTWDVGDSCFGAAVPVRVMIIFPGSRRHDTRDSRDTDSAYQSLPEHRQVFLIGQSWTAISETGEVKRGGRRGGKTAERDGLRAAGVDGPAVLRGAPRRDGASERPSLVSAMSNREKRRALGRSPRPSGRTRSSVRPFEAEPGADPETSKAFKRAQDTFAHPRGTATLLVPAAPAMHRSKLHR